MDWYYTIIMFMFGAAFGSFFNVVGYRLPNNMSLIKPGSSCPNCGHELGALELIPIFSYIFLRAKCKKCKKKIPPFYMIFELLTGILFAFAYYKFGFTLDLVIPLTFISFVVIVMVSDFLTMIIPDEVIIFFGIVFFFEILLINGSTAFAYSIVNGLITFAVMFLIKKFGDFLFKKDSMGGGDLKLLLVIGIVLGYEMGLITIFLSSFIAFPVALLVLLIKKEKIIPYGPFIGLAALIIMFFKINLSAIMGILT